MNSKNKIFYWLKLQNNFFDLDAFDYLLSLKDGANYIVIYQMLCMKTINTKGELATQIGGVLIPFDEEKIQRECKHFSIDTVRMALGLYKKLGIVFEQENGILKISDFEQLVGSETYWARIKRAENEKKAQNEEKVGNFPEIVQNPLISNICSLNENYIDNSKASIGDLTYNKENNNNSISVDNKFSINENNISICEQVANDNAKIEVDKKEQQNKKGEKETPPDVSDLFAFWKENNLKGREATQGAIKATMKALKAYSVEEIKVAIKHYAICLHDKGYYFNYPWSMEQFMARREAIPHFLEDGDIWQDYENKHSCMKLKATVEDYEKIINEQEKNDWRSQL